MDECDDGDYVDDWGYDPIDDWHEGMSEPDCECYGRGCRRCHPPMWLARLQSLRLRAWRLTHPRQARRIDTEGPF